jgi:hypothetical protein
MVEREQMRIHEIGDMDVVANACAVGRRVVRAEDVELRDAPECDLAGALDEVVRTRRRLPVRPLGSAPATLK